MSKKGQAANNGSQSRSYADADLKLLFGLSGGYCAYPKCNTKCILESTEQDSKKNISNIAHIVAHSDIGPRADPTLSAKDRDRYDNLVVLCPTHHAMVDSQSSTFTIAMLREWKIDLEEKVQRSLELAMTKVTFYELDFICRSMVGSSLEPTSNFNLTNPAAKMEKNSLKKAEKQLTMGLAKAAEVHSYIQFTAQIEPNFPEKLKAGFLDEYHRLLETGLIGDELFDALVEFACRNVTEKKMTYQMTAVAVLSYMFERCEVFEP